MPTFKWKNLIDYALRNLGQISNFLLMVYKWNIGCSLEQITEYFRIL